MIPFLVSFSPFFPATLTEFIHCRRIEVDLLLEEKHLVCSVNPESDRKTDDTLFSIALQGLPLNELLLTRETEKQLADLAGNAMWVISSIEKPRLMKLFFQVHNGCRIGDCGCAHPLFFYVRTSSYC